MELPKPSFGESPGTGTQSDLDLATGDSSNCSSSSSEAIDDGWVRCPENANTPEGGRVVMVRSMIMEEGIDVETKGWANADVALEEGDGRDTEEMRRTRVRLDQSNEGGICWAWIGEAEEQNEERRPSMSRGSAGIKEEVEPDKVWMSRMSQRPKETQGNREQSLSNQMK
jgi:hypothetical protein